MSSKLPYKFVHVMLHSSIHNKSIIELINTDTSFIPSEHLFVIKSRELFEECKEFTNVIVDEDIISRNMKNFIKLEKQCKYIFLHSHSLSVSQLYRLNKSILNKIVWCVWGHDLYNHKRQSLSSINGAVKKSIVLCKNILINVYDKIWAYKTKQFFAVGIGFIFDSIEVKRKFGKNMRILTTPYGYRKNNIEIMKSALRSVKNVNNSPYKIMVGHSSYKFLNHIEILKSLEKYKEENIMISLILSYGDYSYAKEVEKFAITLFKDKVEIIKSNMSKDEYLNYLDTVDACILDFTHQSALGNIYRILYLGKKLFLNRDGIIKTALMLEGIETYNINNIANLNFQQFSAPVEDKSYGINFATKILDETTHVKMWRSALRELD